MVRGGIRKPALGPVSPASPQDQEIKFGARVGCPAVHVVPWESTGPLLDGKPFEGASDSQIPEQEVVSGSARQRMQEPSVAHVHPRCPDLALPRMIGPEGQRTHQQRTCRNLEIVPGGSAARTQRPREPGGRLPLAVRVGDHRPDAPGGLGGNGEAESGDVPLEEGSE